jgi:hypothetical protein
LTRLVHAELLKIWTTRTARIVLALAAAGTAVAGLLVFAAYGLALALLGGRLVVSRDLS